MAQRQSLDPAGKAYLKRQAPKLESRLSQAVHAVAVKQADMPVHSLVCYLVDEMATSEVASLDDIKRLEELEEQISKWKRVLRSRLATEAEERELWCQAKSALGGTENIHEIQLVVAMGGLPPTLSPLSVDDRRLCLSIEQARVHECSPELITQAQDRLQAAKLSRKACTHNLRCNFWFVDAEKLRADDDPTPLPPFKEMRRRPGWLTLHTFEFADAIAHKYADEYCVVSHRWDQPGLPDSDGSQLAELRAFLRERPSLRWVWFDYWCMPQGARSPAEFQEFTLMLSSVNLLYISATVLCIVDLSYVSRFWTQFEAWLACKKSGPAGLIDADPTERRCHIRTIHNAPESFAQAIYDMWAHRSAAEAREILARPDVTVTNARDKTVNLNRITEFNSLVAQHYERNLDSMPMEELRDLQMALRKKGEMPAAPPARMMEMLDMLFSKMDADHDGAVCRADAELFWTSNFPQENTNSMFNSMTRFRAEVACNQKLAAPNADGMTVEEISAFFLHALHNGFEEGDVMEEIEIILEGGSWVDFDNGRLMW